MGRRVLLTEATSPANFTHHTLCMVMLGETLSMRVATQARSRARRAILRNPRSVLPCFLDMLTRQWFNVKDELTRYMYETRGAVRGLAKTPDQKNIAKRFFEAIEEASLQATLKNQDKCAAASADSAKLLDQFVASL